MQQYELLGGGGVEEDSEEEEEDEEILEQTEYQSLPREEDKAPS